MNNVTVNFEGYSREVLRHIVSGRLRLYTSECVLREVRCAFACDADVVIARDARLLEQTKFGFTAIRSPEYFLKKIFLHDRSPGDIQNHTRSGRCAS